MDHRDGAKSAYFPANGSKYCSISTSSWKSCGFSRNKAAPDSYASRISKSEFDVDRMITGMCLKSVRLFNSLRVCLPSLSGILRSRMMILGCLSPVSNWIASSAPAASLMAQLISIFDIASMNSSRSTGSSSIKRISSLWSRFITYISPGT